VLDLKRQAISFIPIQRSTELNDRPSTIQQHEWQMLIKSSAGVLAAQANNGMLLSIDSRANIRQWEIVPSLLEISLDNWKTQMRPGGEQSLEIEYLTGGRTDLSGPKHGKVDPENQPHVGGNQWAGGSGGRDTAGKAIVTIVC
jgi:von Willebrand factor A domain-containing protein 8